MAALRLLSLNNYLRRSASADQLGKKNLSVNEPPVCTKVATVPGSDRHPQKTQTHAPIPAFDSEKRGSSTSFEHERRPELIYRDQDDRAAAARIQKKSYISSTDNVRSFVYSFDKWTYRCPFR